MSNSKAIGVAYSDPEFESLSVTGATSLTGAQTVGGALTVTGALNANGGGSLGNASTDTVAFYGATVTTQPATIAAVTTATLTSVTTTAATTSSPWGYGTSTQADAVVTLVNALATRAGVLTTQGNAYRTSLIALGLVAAV